MPPGQRLAISGAATDPDGDAVAFEWWQYDEAGTYAGKIALENPTSRDTAFTVPAGAKPGVTIHVILEPERASSRFSKGQDRAAAHRPWRRSARSSPGRHARAA